MILPVLPNNIVKIIHPIWNYQYIVMMGFLLSENSKRRMLTQHILVLLHAC